MQIIRNAGPVCTAIATLVLAVTAYGQESGILRSLAAGQIKSNSTIPLPEAAQALPPDWADQSAGFVTQITNGQAKTITDRAYPLMVSKWPFNSVAVCWENPTPATAGERSWVRDAVTAVRLTEGTISA
jgi:hypothetical protein